MVTVRRIALSGRHIRFVLFPYSSISMTMEKERMYVSRAELVWPIGTQLHFSVCYSTTKIAQMRKFGVNDIMPSTEKLKF